MTKQQKQSIMVSMKIAITGKGGVGKSTISGLIARDLRDRGRKVLAIDADPDMNLATILGFPSTKDIVPIIEYKELIAERTETEVGKPAPFFKMNPRVDDIPDTYCVEHNGIKLMTMGTTRLGGGGCACPENAFLKSLLSHLVVSRDESVILDMEAGIEHLGRGTAIGVEVMCVVVEPSLTSMETAGRIKKLSADIGIKRLVIIGNKVENEKNRKFIQEHAQDIEIAGYIGYSDEIRRINTGEIDAFSLEGGALEEVKGIIDRLNSKKE